MPGNRLSNARPTLKVLVPAMLALGCVSEDTAIEVALEVLPSIDDATLATADTVRVASSEVGYVKESALGHRMARTGETLIYRPLQAGVPFDLSVALLSNKVAIACGAAKGVTAKDGETVQVAVLLSPCAPAVDRNDAATAEIPGTTPAPGDADEGLDRGSGSDDAAGARPDAVDDLMAASPGDADANPEPPDAAPDVASESPPPTLPTGANCNADSECLSTFCVQGVCCAERCSGLCNVCDRPDKLGVCQVLPSTECSQDTRVADLWPFQCVGGGYNPDGDGPRRGSNRSRGATWEVDLTIGDPSPACVRNSPADPPCASATWQLDLGFAFTTAAE